MFVKLAALAAIVALANGHGFLKVPLARTSIQTQEELMPPFWWEQEWWWDHQGVWCGNVLQDTQYSACGRCGDRLGETGTNQDGIYDKKIITGTYQAGQVRNSTPTHVHAKNFVFDTLRTFSLKIIDLVAEFGANHYGHYYVELCPQETETDNCFQTLPIVGGSREVRDGNRI